MRVVLDTNILISACLSPHGNEAHLFRLALAGHIQPYLSAPVLAEYEDVASRKKFAAHHACLQSLLAKMRQCAHAVVPETVCTAASDEDDNRLLECAQAAQAAFLITGNKAHFPDEHAGTRIVNARQFLTLTGFV